MPIREVSCSLPANAVAALRQFVGSTIPVTQLGCVYAPVPWASSAHARYAGVSMRMNGYFLNFEAENSGRSLIVSLIFLEFSCKKDSTVLLNGLEKKTAKFAVIPCFETVLRIFGTGFR